MALTPEAQAILDDALAVEKRAGKKNEAQKKIEQMAQENPLVQQIVDAHTKLQGFAKQFPDSQKAQQLLAHSEERMAKLPDAQPEDIKRMAQTADNAAEGMAITASMKTKERQGS